MKDFTLLREEEIERAIYLIKITLQKSWVLNWFLEQWLLLQFQFLDIYI